MFVIQKFINDLRAKDEAWEHARDKWLNEASEYDYRSERDYRSKHPRPTARLKRIMTHVAVYTGIALVGFLLLGFGLEVAERKKNQPKEPVVQAEGKNCQKFNKDDYVRVQYGDYADKTGNIVGGCNSGEPYQVKLEAGQKASVPNDGHAEEVDVSGRTIGVDNENNLVVIDKKE